MKWAAIVVGPVLAGCALTTAGPGGPLASGTSMQIGVTSAVAYGPATATVNGMPVSGNAQINKAGGSNAVPNPIPITVGVRQQVGASFEVSGDVGWVDSGVGLRFRLPFSDEAPLVLSTGARTGEISAFGRPSYNGTLALEAYPALRVREGDARRLMFSLGVAAGAFEHDLSLPSSFDSSSDAPHGFASEIVIRPELRLQAAVGLHLQGRHASIGFALEPWVVLASEAPTHSTCDQCQGAAALSAFSQTWGISLLVMPAVRL
jgi:hypothetical protein